MNRTADIAPADIAPADSSTDGTATRILDAAERLFAKQGIEAASVRAITRAAGANVAAVHYYFGSKHDLVLALVERRVSEMNSKRRPLLDAALKRATVTPVDIAEAWVRPLASMAFDDDGANRSYLAFLAVLQSSPAETRALGNEVFRPQQQRFAVLLDRALPHCNEPTRWFRFTAAADATIHGLANVERAAGPWREHGGISTEQLVEHYIDAMAGMLAGPAITG